MSNTPHTQRTIVVAHDLDGTLAPDTVLHTLMGKCGYNAEDFFKKLAIFEQEVEDSGLDMDLEHAYMNFLLKWVNYEVLPAIDNQYLFNAGKEHPFFPGVVDYLQRTKQMVQKEFGNHGVTLEHHIVSTGLRQMILGSEIAPFVDYVFASEFMDGKHVNSGQTTIQYIAKALGPTEKADVFFRINKGQYIDKLIDHDDRMPHDQRPVPFPNMMFLLDGFTDRRACALLFDRGSYNIAVHDPNSEKSKKTVTKLFENRRVHTYAPANYCKGSALSVIIDARIMQVGERLVR